MAHAQFQGRLVPRVAADNASGFIDDNRNLEAKLLN